MEKPITPEQEFEADIRNDETFKERLNRAKKPIVLDLNLAQHIADVKADLGMEHNLYLEDRHRFFETKRAADEMFQELMKYDRAGLEAKKKAVFDELFSASLGMAKHNICQSACLVEFSNSLAGFTYQTMGKSFETNLKDMIQKKFDEHLARFAELMIIAKRAGIDPQERLGKKMKELEEVANGTDKQDPTR